MDTIVPAWYGDKLDLDLAIWSCFANVKVAEQRRQKREAEQAQASDTAAA